jgi:hypothetical protein
MSKVEAASLPNGIFYVLKHLAMQNLAGVKNIAHHFDEYELNYHSTAHICITFTWYGQKFPSLVLRSKPDDPCKRRHPDAAPIAMFRVSSKDSVNARMGSSTAGTETEA